MNTRSTILVPEGVWSGVWQPLGTWPDPQPEEFRIPYFQPEITGLSETYTGPNPSKGRTWTSFSHYKRVMNASSSTFSLPYSASWPNSGGRCWRMRCPWWFGWFEHGGDGGYMPLSSLLIPSVGASGHCVPAPTNLGMLKQRGLDSIMPGIKAEMSLLNSAIELKDFRSTVRGVQNYARDFSNALLYLPRQYWGHWFVEHLAIGWTKYLRDLKARSKSGSSSNVLREASSKYLQWKFAWAPLIRDVQSVRKALSSFEKQLNRLVSNEGRVRTGHWSTTFEERPAEKRVRPFGWSPSSYPLISTGNRLESSTSATSCTFHVEMRYNYNLTQYQREHARVLGLLDAFGLNFNPAILWNATKYTFILDWVIGVGRYLDQFKVQNMEPRINILGALWSARYERTIDSTKYFETAFSDLTGAKASMPQTKETAYIRQIFSPGLNSLTTSGVNSSELTLGAALVIARRRRVRK